VPEGKTFHITVQANPFLRRMASAPYDWLTFVLLLILTLTVALTYGMYGFTIDESTDHLKAMRIVEFITSFGRDTEAVKIDQINIYGAMPDLIALALQRLIPMLSFDSRHLVSALFGLGGVYYLYRVGSVFVGSAVGFFSALFLASNPMWFGYMFLNTKDIPFAATLLAAYYYTLCTLTARYNGGCIRAKLGIATGLLATTKLIGIFVLGLIGILTLLVLLSAPSAVRLRIDRAFFGRLLKAAASAVTGCLVCFAVFWPQFFLWSPTTLVTVIQQFMSYEDWHGNVLIRGELFSADHVPWYYMLAYFSISMPLFLLALIGMGAFYGVRARESLVISSIAACVVFFPTRR
jgi:hypothetical protein